MTNLLMRMHLVAAAGRCADTSASFPVSEFVAVDALT